MNYEITNQDSSVYSNQSIAPEMRTEILAEYTALRGEVIKRLEMRHQILTFTLVIAGTFLAFGVRQEVTPLVLLLYPILAVFLALEWMHDDFRAGEIGEYVKDRTEKLLKGLHWETSLQNKRVAKPVGRFFRATEVSAVGVFIATELLAVLLAIPRLTFSTEEIILLSGDGFSIIFTFLVLRRRRKAIHKRRKLVL